MDIEKIKEQAEKEIKDEDFKKAVSKYKERLRSRRRLIDVVFPYKIILIKKEVCSGSEY